MKHWFPRWTIPTLILLSISTVWLRLSIVKTVYTINQTEGMIKNSKHDLEKSSLKVSSLRSPRRLELLSKARFNLTQPNSNQVVYIK